MAQRVYSDPTYLSLLGCLSTVPLSPSSLHLLNPLLDELLQITIHLILLPSSNDSSSQNSLPVLPVTIDQFKSTFQRIVGMGIGKECLVGAEMAVREVLKRSGNGNSLKADQALSTSSSSKGNSREKMELTMTMEERNKVAEEIFTSLREWIMQISGLGSLCPRSGPSNLTTHLSELIAFRNPPPPSSPHVSFLLTLYIERTLSSLSLHLLESISGVVSRSTGKEEATIQDLETAFKEDEGIWTWVKGMKVAKVIEENSQREVMKSPTMGASFATQQQQQQQMGRGRNGLGIRRRESIESNQSAGTSTTMGGGTSGHRRKPSLALSVVQSLNSNLSSDDPFDQLLNSGQTMKLSMTPDRLRLIELEKEKEKLRKASELDLRKNSSSLKSAPPSAPAAPPPVPTLPSSTSILTESGARKKLQARGPHQKDLFNEEDEDSLDDRDSLAQQEKRKKQSLMNLLASPPPWSSCESPSPAPGGVAMESQNSQSSSSAMTRTDSSITSSVATGGGGEEAWVNVSPMKRQKGLKPKDEKRDLASERQINNDLVSFFRNSPPTSIRGLPQTTDQPVVAPSSPPLAGKRSKGGLRGFMNKVTSRRSASSSSEDPSSSLNPFMSLAEPTPPPPQTQRAPTPSNGGTGPRTPRMRSISAQSTLSQGGGGGNSTAYALPPGLGETPNKEREKKRSPRERQRSESANRGGGGAGAGERFQLGSSSTSNSMRDRSPPTAMTTTTSQAPVSILKSNSVSGSKRSSRYASSEISDDTTPTLLPPPPPVPLLPPNHIHSNPPSTSTSSSITTVVRPQRSSSLKRTQRDKSSSTPRSREVSAGSTTSTLNSTSLRPQGSRPASVTRVSPINLNLIPNGLTTPSPDPGDTSTTTPPERFSSSSSSESESGEEEEEGTTEETNHQDLPLPLPLPSSSKSKSKLSPPSSPVKLKQLLLVDSSSSSSSASRRHSTGGALGLGRSITPSPRSDLSRSPGLLTPVKEVSHPNLLKAQGNGLGLGLAGIETNGNENGNGWRDGDDGVRGMFRELKRRMEGECQTKEECIELVETLLKDRGGERQWSRRGGDETKMVEHFLEA
ncbi:uncharacterized protein JCM6883_006952 [Sporobolomyces salmoneus]|uniref:uncharacterized protein n=1 Tax=Sporobolomyces salmoneus TaxID=183962 RepID=UPI0031776B16